MGLQTDVIYTDFKKAFNTVPHDELLFKLWSIGCVSINNKRSSMLPVLSGVPQRSILGPLLFLVYINDLPLAVTFSKLLLFADDGKCALPISISSDSLKLQRDIHSLSKTWNLHFNSEKFTLLHFFSTLTSTFTINSLPRAAKTSHKDLGVIISA